MRRNFTRQHSKGFTLLEVLLAMAISAAVAVLAYSQLSVAITATEVHEAKAKQLADIQLVLNLIERDIRSVINRSIRDEFDEQQPAIIGGELQEYVLRLTRNGWDNPQQLDRGEMQRVRYRWENRELWREYWPVLDRDNQEDGLQKVRLLANVDEFNIEFLAVAAADNTASSAPTTNNLPFNWVSSWTEEKKDLPAAVKIQLDIEGFGRLERVYEIIAQ